MSPLRKYVMIVPDGAGDLHRTGHGSPLMAADTPYMDFLAREGVSGLMRTLYPDLPKESLVAQMGMLGWDPRRCYPGGRASCELLAVQGTHLAEGDLAFRANLTRVSGRTLVSYNAEYILDREAVPLVDRLNGALREDFPEFELYHNSDFRTTLVFRGARVRPGQIRCPEPHESHGREFSPATLVSGTDTEGAAAAARICRYLERAFLLLEGERANGLFPWSPSTALHLQPFSEVSEFGGRVAMVGAMDFLCGLARAGGIEFHRVGNGRPDTDYAGKGERSVQLLEDGCQMVYCHVNAPDEASHMQDPELKVRCLERIDAEVVWPIVRYFQARPEELGGVMLVPDHYTNSWSDDASLGRAAVHSLDRVPFALWNGRDRDAVQRFSEDDAIEGRYAHQGLTHLDLLRILKGTGPQTATADRGGSPATSVDALAGHSGRSRPGEAVRCRSSRRSESH